MNYSETCEYLFTRTPLFSKTGASAYKPGLQTTHAFDEHLGHPHQQYRTIHVAGTNGKGSTSHSLAAILQQAGYRVGLFTSPHLVDFRERIRVNGEMCSEEFVVDFVEKHRSFFEPLYPSFFEVTTAMAFCYFAEQKVDVAVVEVGLGGRLDCTNIITPDLSIITNISLDHTDLLGATIAEIAAEKAGIMKAGIPCVIGETTKESLPVFTKRAEELGSPLILAEHSKKPLLATSLLGDCQHTNLRTILSAVDALRQQPYYHISDEHVSSALQQICALTGLRGRWETLSRSPLTICDVGHNPGAWEYLGPRLSQIAEELAAEGHNLHIVFGMVNDKDVHTVLSMLPRQGRYYFTQANSHRAIPATELAAMAAAMQIQGEPYPTVAAAYASAKQAATPHDTLFIGGSCYIVADLLATYSQL